MPDYKQQVLDKLTIRNIVTLASTGVFLYAVVFSLHNTEVIVQAIEDTPKGIILTGGIIIGTFVKIIADVYTFYYRKAQKKESKEN